VDKYKIDSHKLYYHIPELNKWLHNQKLYPIYIEVSPSGTCNHRCTFCALDYMEYKNRFLDHSVYEKFVKEISCLGVKSIMLAGEGEPLLHKNISNLILQTKNFGIDVAITTNGVLLYKLLSEKILSHVEWIKISINAGTKETYSKIHQTQEKDFTKVLSNIEAAVRIKQDNKINCTIGMQMVLLPDNKDEVVSLAHQAKDLQVDYLVVKPYSHHHSSKTKNYKHIEYKEYYHLAEKLRAMNTDDFNIVFRLNTMKKWDKKLKNFHKCLALPFWSYIDAAGNVWGCSAYLQNEKFRYGNINDSTFQKIWNGEKRMQSLKWVESELDIEQCRTNCRMASINKYLWDLKYPPQHVNFI